MTGKFQIGDLVRHINDHAKKGEDGYAIGYVYGYQTDWLDGEAGVQTSWVWKEGDTIERYECVYPEYLLYKVEESK